jgi:hypothetical protein
MKDFDQKELDALLDSGRFSEADAYVKNLFAVPPKPSDDADAAIDYALMRLKMMNLVNRRYLESIQGIADLLEKTRFSEKDLDDASRLAALRSEVAGRS